MRSDMKWILGDKRGSRVGGPRKGKRFSPAEFRKFDWDVDDSPFVGGIVGHGLEKALIGARRWNSGYNLKPLERYLARQVGRAWNDVQSDIRVALRGSEIAEENWPHLLSAHVAVSTEAVDGNVKVERWDGGTILLSDRHAPPFYVDPASGYLHRNTMIETCRMRAKRMAQENASELATRMRSLTPTRQLHLLADGNWWEVTLIDMGLIPVSERRPIYDVVLKAGLSELTRESLYGRAGVFASAKRSLSAREIKRYALR